MTELRELSLKQIAETTQAKFEYWIQDKWNVLPTDPRYRELTEEQLDLLFIHYQRLNPPPEEKEDNKARDEDYDAEDAKSEAHESSDNESGRLPIQDFEHYEDPDFDAEWNSEDEEEYDSDIIDENPPLDDFEEVGEAETIDTKSDMIKDDWEEV